MTDYAALRQRIAELLWERFGSAMVPVYGDKTWAEIGPYTRQGWLDRYAGGLLDALGLDPVGDIGIKRSPSDDGSDEWTTYHLLCESGYVYEFTDDLKVYVAVPRSGSSAGPDKADG